MADNILIDQGSTTALRTKDVGGVHHGVAINMDSTGAEVGVAAKPFQVSLANHGANATAVKVDGSAVTQPVSLASVPSHAVTNAGTFAVQVSSALPAGTNNIGDVDVVSLPALPAGTNNIGDVDILSLPALAAGTNLIGKASAGLDVSSAYDGSTALPIKFAAIAASSSGDNTLIAAVTSKKIRVLGYSLIAAGTVNVRFESGAGGTALTGVMPLVANMGLSPNGSFPQFETASNTLLNLELSAAVSVAGHITYVEV